MFELLFYYCTRTENSSLLKLKSNYVFAIFFFHLKLFWHHQADKTTSIIFFCFVLLSFNIHCYSLFQSKVFAAIKINYKFIIRFFRSKLIVLVYHHIIKASNLKKLSDIGGESKRHCQRRKIISSFFCYYAIIHIITKTSLGSRFSLRIMNRRATASATVSANASFQTNTLHTMISWKCQKRQSFSSHCFDNPEKHNIINSPTRYSVVKYEENLV